MTNVTKIVAQKVFHPHKQNEHTVMITHLSLFFCLQDDETDDWIQQKAPKYEFKTPPKSTNLKITASQKVVKKYRKYVKNAEFRRLKSIVPTLAKKNDASKVSFKKFEFSRLKLFFCRLRY